MYVVLQHSEVKYIITASQHAVKYGTAVAQAVQYGTARKAQSKGVCGVSIGWGVFNTTYYSVYYICVCSSIKYWKIDRTIITIIPLSYTYRF